MRADRSRLNTLTDAAMEDLAHGFHVPAEAAMLRRLLRTPAGRVAHSVVEFDDLVDTHGLVAGARWVMVRFAQALLTVGRETVPPEGPLLAVANHPGVTDAMALIIALEARPDLKLLALDRTLLRALPAVASRLIWVDPRHPASAVRPARDHLRAGGALLTFPAGTIEPDPMVRSGAVASLHRWSRSTDLLARHVPGIRVLPLAVGGVISTRARRTAIARRAATVDDRDWTAGTLQILLPHYRDTEVRVLVGVPFEAAGPVTPAIVAQMENLLVRLADGRT